MKNKKYLGIGYILAGAVFLFNPIISIFDILPDFLGYLFVLRGIYALADINVYLEDAKKQVKCLALSSLGRALSILFVFGIASPREQSTLLVLMSFVFGVIDGFLLISAWKNIFGGITYLATTIGGDAALKQIKGGSLTDRMQRSTAFSLIFIQAMAFLPELASLTDRSVYTDLESSIADFSSFMGLFRGAAIIAALAVGIIWLVKIFRYVKALKGDKPFFERLNDKYSSEVLSRPEIFTVRGINRGLICLSAAFIFCIDFYDSEKFGCNVIPDVISAVLLVVGLLLIRKYVKGWLIPTLLSLAYGVFEVAVWIAQYGFFKSASAADIFKSHTAYGAYYRMCAVTFVGEVLFLIAVIAVLITLRKIIKSHTGVSELSQSGFNHSAERTKYIHRSLTVRLVVIGLLALLATGATVTYFMSLPYAYRTLWEAFWILNMIVCGVFAATFISFSSNLRERMKYKYGLI